ncbi:tryptophan-rich sensory protein [Tessaracoccus rhinocerotis]|uniref:Tryptophan-rich sensory protein n=1 Tax=Tessaracoccus rhinocerotis TaxID=1689449 RepID=A0A553K5R5_9ACTN|nr:TspO/MBR family protein [Tessaracoccus rhinocerotis]TRY20044.1 tryptophan-rich sensory protein [Tessaracoccus rhinocerotis]
MPRKKNHSLSSFLGATAAVVTTAVAGSVATDPKTAWYKSLDKPRWQPPPAVFPVAWTALYTSIALVSGKVLADTKAEGDDERHRDYKAALVLNLILNAGWSFAFFKAKKLGLASIVAGALAASSADLSKRAGQQDPKLGLALKPYSAWTSFATALSTDIWRRNRD